MPYTFSPFTLARSFAALITCISRVRCAQGIVNLPAMRPPRGHTKGDAQQSLGCDGNPADIRPHLERTHPCGTILDGGDVVAAEVEEVGDLIVGGEETLCLSR